MAAKDGKPRFDWHAPLENRARLAVIAVAALILVGAVVAAIVLRIPFF